MKSFLAALPAAASFLIFVAGFAAGAIWLRGFGSARVLLSLVEDGAFLGIAALGGACIILGRGIDLSPGAMIALVSVFAANAIEAWSLPPATAALLAVVLSVLVLTTMGLIIHRFDLPPFLVTLAAMFGARGAAFWISPNSIAPRNESLERAASFAIPIGDRLSIGPCTVLWALSAALAFVLLERRRFGPWLRAVGGNEESARLAGIAVGRTRVLSYAVAGAFTGVAGIAYLLYTQKGDPTACTGLELDVIAACVIGGASLRGGRGSAACAIGGTLLLGLIQSLITFSGTLDSWWTRIATGALLFVFLANPLARRAAS